ncbi:hypothetical protein [Fodinibius sp. Rm-B-1B1-1]|uniref:hypothetical protein n=1 Tax=Fodinibius alkaliphilus TaxID=3140241 RepID=UPI00315A8791
MQKEEIDKTFLTHAASILGETHSGLSGSEIVDKTSKYAFEYNVELPHSDYPFKGIINKRTALKDNLECFTPAQQFKIIKDICELEKFQNNSKAKDLKIKLISRYSHFSDGLDDSSVNEILIEETTHWLKDYPKALKIYERALTKFENDAFERNTLDDLRLSLEILLKSIFNNNKSLENQISNVGNHLKTKGGSPELRNMFVRLINYYTHYQNSYVKHDDAVIEEEIEFIFEITSSFMKHIIRMS